MGLYYPAIIKTRCPPASEFRNSETRLSKSDPPASRCEALRAGGRQAPGVLHHVMGRGIERKRLFIDKRDRQDFNTRLAALAFEKLCTFCTSVGAADKAAIQLVEVQPYQLLVSDT